MSLSNIYSSQVKKSKITNLTIGGSFPQIEKDPTIMKLEKQMFEKFNEIVPKEDVKPTQTEVTSVSVEDALKELLKLKNNKSV